MTNPARSARRKRVERATPIGWRCARRAFCAHARADSVDTEYARADSVTCVRIILRDSSDSLSGIDAPRGIAGEGCGRKSPTRRHEGLAAAGKDGPWTAGSQEGRHHACFFRHRRAARHPRNALAAEKPETARVGIHRRTTQHPVPAPRSCPHGRHGARRDPRAADRPLRSCCPPGCGTSRRRLRTTGTHGDISHNDRHHRDHRDRGG